jgi:antitoxin (DNA-binding transcriptional repressor) of toxin-antitoxin stability system
MLPDITAMTPLTEDELLADFDGILDRVEAGECFLIAGRAGGPVVLIPYNAETRALLDQADASPSTPASSD